MESGIPNAGVGVSGHGGGGGAAPAAGATPGATPAATAGAVLGSAPAPIGSVAPCGARRGPIKARVRCPAAHPRHGPAAARPALAPGRLLPLRSPAGLRYVPAPRTRQNPCQGSAPPGEPRPGWAPRRPNTPVSRRLPAASIATPGRCGAAPKPGTDVTVV